MSNVEYYVKPLLNTYNKKSNRMSDTWDNKAIALLDLDAFFASVEQLDNPYMKGFPVVVGGLPNTRGVVSTCSYEARKYGIHSAMSSSQAYKLCPNAYFIKPRMDRYHEVSRQVMDIIYQETPFIQQVSVDEAFFDITPGRYSKESPKDIIKRIQTNVAKLGITCSIGLGTNKTIAKIASEINKPNSLFVVEPGCEQEFLAPLDVKRMSGIGPVAQRKLKNLGIFTLGQLAQTDAELLQQIFGVAGITMKNRALGIEDSKVLEASSDSGPKSVSNERTFSTDLYKEEDIKAGIHKMSSMVGRRLRKNNLQGLCVSLRIKYDHDSSRAAQIQLPHPTSDTQQIAHAATKLLNRIWKPGQSVRLIGVEVSKLDSSDQLAIDLFDDMSESDNKQLTNTADKIKEKFGDNSIKYGRELRLQNKFNH